MQHILHHYYKGQSLKACNIYHMTIIIEQNLPGIQNIPHHCYKGQSLLNIQNIFHYFYKVAACLRFITAMWITTKQQAPIKSREGNGINALIS